MMPPPKLNNFAFITSVSLGQPHHIWKKCFEIIPNLHLNVSYCQPLMLSSSKDFTIFADSSAYQSEGNMTKTRQVKNPRVRPMRGSRKYRHLLDFIERRRRMKLEKRATLDLSAQVIAVHGDHVDDNDDVVDVAG